MACILYAFKVIFSPFFEEELCDVSQ